MLKFNKLNILFTLIILFVSIMIFISCKNFALTDSSANSESDRDDFIVEMLETNESDDYEIFENIVINESTDEYYVTDGSDIEDLELEYLEDLINNDQLNDYYDNIDYSEMPVG